MDPLDPKRLTLRRTPAVPAPRSEKPPRHKPGEKFLKGPVPWDWIARAAQQPGKALHVAIALWFMAGIKRARTVALPGLALRVLGVSRYAGYRALAALDEAGLVAVARHPGRNPVVTILEADEQA